ncbi:MAG: hypothetical protein ACM3N0_08290 [Chloroflexota bacterium]
MKLEGLKGGVHDVHPTEAHSTNDLSYLAGSQTLCQRAQHLDLIEHVTRLSAEGVLAAFLGHALS